MSLTVHTESGSVYNFNKRLTRVRRSEHVRGYGLRADGQWIQLLETPNIAIGVPMYLTLEPLGDDTCTPRITSPVTKIERKRLRK